MPQQLFLFDDENSDDIQNAPMIADTNASLLTNDGKKLAIAGDRYKNFDAQNVENTADNPFAAVQQQQQDKIDIMLLTPNRKRGRKSFRDMDEEAILIAVPEDDVLYQKQYYPTRVVAEWFGITQSQLRAWEVEFDILQPKKNSKGDRFFRPEDVKNLKLIYHLLRRRKFTVQGAKQYLDDNKKSLQTTMQLTESLQKFKQFLLELKAISG